MANMQPRAVLKHFGFTLLDQRTRAVYAYKVTVRGKTYRGVASLIDDESKKELAFVAVTIGRYVVATRKDDFFQYDNITDVYPSREAAMARLYKDAAYIKAFTSFEDMKAAAIDQILNRLSREAI